MKKQMILVLLLAFAAFANPIQAQEVGSSLQQEIDSLKTVIMARDKEIKEKEKMLEGNRTIKLLQQQINSHERNIRNYQSKIDKAQHNLDSIQGSLEEMRRPCDSLKSVNMTLENYKTQVSPLVSKQLKQMATTVDNIWLGKSYAETDMVKLSEELKLYEDFKEQDRGVAEAYKKLTAFGENVMLFTQGVEIVNSPYDSVRIAAIIQPFENLIDKERHTGRKAESAAVLSQLKGYSDCLRCFQKDIIVEVERRCKNYKDEGTDSMAWIQLKRFLESSGGSANVKKISQIPWLEKQYHLYVKQLEANPYIDNFPARDAIMSLVP